MNANVNLNLEFSTTNVPTVEQLRKNGYKVRVMHERFQFQPWVKLSHPPKDYSPWGPLRPQFELKPPVRAQKGGRTTIEITAPNGKNYSGVALCSKEDSFDRKKGVKICLGRIAKKIEEEIKNNEVPF